jgi:hypothetical protein
MFDIAEFSKDPIALGSDCSSGSGLHSEVFKGQIKGTVLKVSKDFKTDGYSYFLYKVLTSKPNPLFPKIFAVHIDADKEDLYVLMEELTRQFDALRQSDPRIEIRAEAKNTVEAEGLFKNIEDVHNFDLYLEPRYGPSKVAENLMSFLEDVVSDLPNLDIFKRKPDDEDEDCDIEYTRPNGIFLDAHSENWMYRKNGELVLIDPFHIIRGFNFKKLYDLAETLDFVTITEEPKT